MKPHYADDWLTVYHGDARSVLSELPAESVHCVVTSPPYWGLRDYGTAAWEGGDEGCDHLGPSAKPSPKSTLGVYADGRTRYKDGWDSDKQAKADYEGRPYGSVCGKCGARRIDSQLGLEPTPEQYVENMVAVFREVRRVLRSDGTVWLNLGDSYAGSWGAQGRTGQMADRSVISARQIEAHPHKASRTGSIDSALPLKPKDLVGIPWRVAFALQADGWYLRSDIIWSKPNPMPESVTDRPTKSHEYLFLLSKSPRYFYDADAVRELDAGLPSGNGFAGRQGLARQTAKHGGVGSPERFEPGAGRNLRSVWSIATAPYPGAHFATFPPKLVEPCIKAGTSEKGVCPECGAPWVREVERELVGGHEVPNARPALADGERSGDGIGGIYAGARRVSASWDVRTTGWRHTCRCAGGDIEWYPVPATVLDPFAGSGTTGMVAQSLSRRAVLIDLSMDYLAQLMERNRQPPLGLPA